MTQITPNEVRTRGIMIDVETAGSYPVRHALLSIGACLIPQWQEAFYVELRPDSRHFDREAMAVHGLTFDRLERSGITPGTALQRLVDWVTVRRARPLFVAHNAAFDWMFLQIYLQRYEIRNPFGHWPFDTKSAYGNIMRTPLPHHARQDAQIQTQDLLRYYRSLE
ncbi:MAG: 3'-5' exonuclease [Patescibacteria group bacterium]